MLQIGRKTKRKFLPCQNRVQNCSYLRRFLSDCEKTRRNKDKRLLTSVSSKTWNSSWNLFFPSQVYWIGVVLFQIIHYNWQLLFGFWFVSHVQLALVTERFTCVVPLNSQGLKCLMLNLAIAWDFSSPHYWLHSSRSLQL